jgi:antibiotic biosynthesis monooxygenase (ABM) superfamily enzyme
MYPHVRQLTTRRPGLEHAPEPRTENRAAPRPAQKPAAPAAGSSRSNLALLTWAGAYAVIIAILAALGPTLAAWPLVLRTLLLSALMVPALTWLIMPALMRLVRAWLAPPD